MIFPAAKLDIKEAALWYNDKQYGLGKRFFNAVNDEVYKIKQNPHMYEIRYYDVRTALTKNFPYLIHFSLMSDTIFIKAVYHTSRNSSLWVIQN